MFHAFDFDPNEKFNTKTILNFSLDGVVIHKLVAPELANKRFFYVKNVLKLGLM